MRNVQLDLLRALAVVLVLGRHMGKVPDDLPPWLYVPMKLWNAAGWMGVDIFFVLSGFLIGGLLFRELRDTGEFSVGRFLTRRALRIYPPFYIMLAATLGFKAWTEIPLWVDPVTPAHIASEVFFMQSYFSGALLHTWSLAVEEHFYLGLPLLLLLLGARRARPAQGLTGDALWDARPCRGLVTACLCIMAGVLIARSAQSIAVGANRDLFNAQHLTTHMRMDALAFGVLLAYLSTFAPAVVTGFVTRHRWKLVVFALLAFAPAGLFSLWDLFHQTVGVTLIYLGAGALMLVLLHTRMPTGRVVTPVVNGFAAMGVCSYSVYLWHMSIIIFGMHGIQAMIARTGWLGGEPGRGAAYVLEWIILMPASVLLGMAAAKLVELPTLAVRDRLFPRRVERGAPEIGVAAHPRVPG